VVRFAGDSYVIAPVVDARNGVKLNQVKIEVETPLKEGDQVALGDTVLQFTELGTLKGDAVHELKAATRNDPTIIQ
jgi:pSer/pThr/pTyr-binding forkhead associated (FHA) protein